MLSDLSGKGHPVAQADQERVGTPGHGVEQRNEPGPLAGGLDGRVAIPKENSTNLDLYILQSEVSKTGGSISAESYPKKGTTFNITLPIERG